MDSFYNYVFIIVLLLIVVLPLATLSGVLVTTKYPNK